jgi:hypothetical protein
MALLHQGHLLHRSVLRGIKEVDMTEAELYGDITPTRTYDELINEWVEKEMVRGNYLDVGGASVAWHMWTNEHGDICLEPSDSVRTWAIQPAPKSRFSRLVSAGRRALALTK